MTKPIKPPPEAERLAGLWSDYLPAYDYSAIAKDTAAELRRVLAVEQATADLRAEVERLREVLKELIRYAKGVHDPHLEELVRDFLKETK
jgi:predicted RNA-binding Zn ribbon-like protein